MFGRFVFAVTESTDNDDGFILLFKNIRIQGILLELKFTHLVPNDNDTLREDFDTLLVAYGCLVNLDKIFLA